MEASTRKATLADAVRVWWHMRAIDREEAAAATRIPVLLTLLWGVLFTEVFALHAGGAPVALMGVRDQGRVYGDTVGYIWMLSTRAVALHKSAVMRACACYVGDCAARFDVLVNAVYAKNDTALRFVRRLGFKVGEPIAVRGASWCPIVRLSCVE